MFSHVEYLAEGGNSVVYEAEYEGKHVAIKVYSKLGDNKRYARFLQELQTLQRLKNVEGIVPLLEVHSNPPDAVIPCDRIRKLSDMAYYVMPKYQMNLNEALCQKPEQDNGIDAVLAILSIAKTVKRLHDTGLAHRDLKPENILLDESNNLLVADFGLSIDLNDTVERFTPASEIVGAINYRAPEFLRGRLDDSDHRPSDIFSLGRMLWALIFGKEAYNLTDLEFERTLTDIKLPIRKPCVLQEIIRGATNVDPKYRLKIVEFITVLEDWLKDNKPISTAGIIDTIANSDEAISRMHADKVKNEIETIHKDTMRFLEAELQIMTGEWSKIAFSGKEGTIISHRPYGLFYPDNLNFWVQSTKKGIGVLRAVVQVIPTKYISVDLGLYIFYDNEDIGKSEYAIVPAYLTPVANPPKNMRDYENIKMAGEIIWKKFDYRSASIKLDILQDLTVAFRRLDKIFRAQFL